MSLTLVPDSMLSQKFDTYAQMVASPYLKVGQYVSVNQGYNNQPETFEVVAAGTYASPDGVLVRNLTGISGQAVSLRTEYANYAEFDADPRKLTSGQYTIPSIGASGTYVSTGQNLTTTAGTKVVVNPLWVGANGGIYVMSHLGAVSDNQSEAGTALTIASGSRALTVTGAAFASTDVGKAIIVPGAGTAGADLVTTIAGYTTPTQVTLAAAAGTALSSVAGSVTYGTDSSAAFAIANALLNATSQAVSLFINGFFWTTTSLSVTQSNKSVYGQSRQNEIFFPTAATIVEFSGASAASHVSNCHAFGLQVRAGWTGAGGVGIQLNHADDSTVKNCRVNGGYRSGFIQNIYATDTNDCDIRGNLVENGGGNGISLDLVLGSESTRGNKVCENIIIYVKDSGIGCHNNTRYNEVANNIIIYPAQGGGGTGIDIAGCQYTHFHGNTVYASSQYGIRAVQNLSYVTVDNTIENNVVYALSTASGASIILADCNRNTVQNNKMRRADTGTPTTGIYIYYTTTATQTHPVTGEALPKLTGSVVSKNEIWGCTNGLTLDAGGGLSGASFIIDANHFMSCSVGLQFTTAASDKRFNIYGHNVYNNCTTDVSSATGGIVQNMDPIETMGNAVNIQTTITATSTTPVAVARILLRAPTNGAIRTTWFVEGNVAETGAYDGVLDIINGASASMGSIVFNEVSNHFVGIEFAATATDLYTARIYKDGSPATGYVNCDGLSVTQRVWY